MSLRIVNPGLLASVQDRGRRGWAHVGVAPAGAADAWSLGEANRLVGNASDAAGIEFTLTGGEVEALAPLTFAVTGADAAVRVASPGGTVRDVGAWAAHGALPGDRIQIGPAVRGVRSLLAVRGGIDVPVVMGSRSTHLAAGFGGFHGRALRAGDVLPVGRAELQDGPPMSGEREGLFPHALRVTAGPHSHHFPPDALGQFLAGEYEVTDRSDRAGVRLVGAPMASCVAGRLASEGMPTGAVQVPENGQPILIGVDGPTTGGYPVLACVIGADLAAMGQLRPRSRVRFRLVSLAEAWRASCGAGDGD